MLMQVLHELRAARGPLSLDELSRRLGIEREVLEGMIQSLVRMGRLHDNQLTMADCGAHCPACAGAEGCALVRRMPRTYTVTARDRAERS